MQRNLNSRHCSNHSPLVSCLHSARSPPYRKSRFPSACLGSFQIENWCLAVFNNLIFLTMHVVPLLQIMIYSVKSS